MPLTVASKRNTTRTLSLLAIATYMRSGLGRFNAIEADRFLKENGISLYPILTGSAHGFSMTSVKPSIENAFAALYTAATSVKADADQLEIVKRNAASTKSARWSIDQSEP